MGEPITLDSFAKAIEANLRKMQAEQTRLIEQAIEADLDPELVFGVMQAMLAKVERETQQ